MKLTQRTGKPETSLMLPDPFEEMLSLRDTLDRLFGESLWPSFSLFNGRRGMCPMGRLLPRVDISETDSEIKLRAEIPGMEPENLDIEVTEDTLSLSGKTERNEEEKKENFRRTERYMGEFSREFRLPCKINPEHVDARAKNGVITITLQKQASEQRKRVPVRVDNN